MQNDRSRQAAAAVVGQRHDVLDLADAVMRVKRGVPDRLTVRFGREKARRHRLAHEAEMRDDLLDQRLVLAVRLASSRLRPERPQLRLADLLNLMLSVAVRPAPLHHQHEALRLPPEADEAGFEPLQLAFVAEADAPVADTGCALDALGLGS